MGKIISLKRATDLSKKMRSEGKTVVLVGGCFDILHLGHIKFLTAAEKEGDVLVVALESDKNVRRLKGNGRPINSQRDRAEVLTALSVVDYVILLPPMESDADYFDLVSKIRPQIIAVTAKNSHLSQKRKQAAAVGGGVKIVIPLLSTTSTTRLARIFEKEGV